MEFNIILHNSNFPRTSVIVEKETPEHLPDADLDKPPRELSEHELDHGQLLEHFLLGQMLEVGVSPNHGEKHLLNLLGAEPALVHKGGNVSVARRKNRNDNQMP